MPLLRHPSRLRFLIDGGSSREQNCRIDASTIFHFCNQLERIHDSAVSGGRLQPDKAHAGAITGYAIAGNVQFGYTQAHIKNAC